MSAITIILLSTTGFTAGVVSGMTGASGVMVVIPILVTFFGMPMYVAIGTSLMADVMQSIPISYAYHRAKNLALREGVWLALGAVVGAQIGAHNVVLVPENLLMIGLAVFMIGLGIKMWREGTKALSGALDTGLTRIMPDAVQREPGRSIMAVALGLLLGVMTGFFGAGGGILIFLILYFVLGVPLKSSIGTAAFIMIITALSGSIGYFAEGNIDITTGLIIGASAAVGGFLSATMANKVDDAVLGKVVGAVFVVIALAMVGIRFIV